MNMTGIHIHQLGWKSLILSRGKWYIFSSFFTKGLGIVLLPIYTRYLSPADYGILSLLNSIGQFLPLLISLNIDAAFGRYFHEDKVDHRQLSMLFSTTYWFVLIYGGFVITVLLVSEPMWADNFPGLPFGYFLLTFIPALLMQLGQLGTIYLRQSLDSRRTTFMEVGTALLSVAVTLPLLIFADFGVLARLIGSTVGTIFSFIYYGNYFIGKKLLCFQWDKRILRKSLLYSLPFLPSVAAGWVAGMSDKLILAKYVSVEAVGVYSLAATLATILYVVQDAVTQVTGAVSMSGLVHSKEVTLLKISNLSLFLWALMLASDLGIVLFSREIITVFATKAYIGSASLIGVCGFVFVISSQYRVFEGVLSLHGKTWIISLAGILMAGVSVTLNFWLIPYYGVLAAAYTYLVSVAVYTCWIIFWAKQYESIKIYTWRMFLLFLMFLFGCWISSLIDEITVVAFMGKIITVSLFSFCTFWLLKLNNK
jgi:O-antigen/teichoic acid export membrane protein